MRSLSILLFSLVILIASCTAETESFELGYYGPRDINPVTGDTIYHEVFDFDLTNQDGEKVTLETYKDKILVTCFFFTSCPFHLSSNDISNKKITKQYIRNGRRRIFIHNSRSRKRFR